MLFYILKGALLPNKRCPFTC